VTQVYAAVACVGDPAVTPAGAALDASLSAVENELHRTKPQASEGSLNFPIKLDDERAGLHDLAESVDGRPTERSYEVFDELNAQLQVQLDRLTAIVGTDVPSFNTLVQSHGLTPISCSAVS
jgi:hypothetical protein